MCERASREVEHGGHVALLAGLTIETPELLKLAPATAVVNQEDVHSTVDSSNTWVPSRIVGQKQGTEESGGLSAPAGAADISGVETGQNLASDPGDSRTAQMEQDMSQPPHYERDDAMSLQRAVLKLLLMGLPFGLAFALVAFILWRRMHPSVHYFSPVVTREI